MGKLKDYFTFLLVSSAVFFAAELAHFVFWGKFFSYLINSLILSVYIIYWSFVKNQNSQNRAFSRYRKSIGVVMLLWFFCKCAKDRFFMESDLLSRLMWYSFYIALILLPLLCYELSLEFDLSPVDFRKKRITALRIAAAVLIAGILTNDFHELAFRFTQGIALWQSEYARGVWYYAALAFCIVLFILAVARIFRQCTLPKSKHYIWLLILPLAAGLIYLILYGFDLDLHINNIRIFALVDIFCWLFMLFFEACDVIFRLATELPDDEVFILRRIYSEIKDRMAQTEKLTADYEGLSEQAYKSNIYRAGFIQTYNKRISNLILLGEQNDMLDFAELTLSLAESVEFLKIGGTDAALFSEGEGLFTAAELVAVYKDFECKTEAVLNELSAVMVVVNAADGKISLHISAEDKEGNAL